MRHGLCGQYSNKAAVVEEVSLFTTGHFSLLFFETNYYNL